MNEALGNLNNLQNPKLRLVVATMLKSISSHQYNTGITPNSKLSPEIESTMGGFLSTLKQQATLYGDISGIVVTDSAYETFGIIVPSMDNPRPFTKNTSAGDSAILKVIKNSTEINRIKYTMSDKKKMSGVMKEFTQGRAENKSVYGDAKIKFVFIFTDPTYALTRKAREDNATSTDKYRNVGRGSYEKTYFMSKAKDQAARNRFNKNTTLSSNNVSEFINKLRILSDTNVSASYFYDEDLSITIDGVEYPGLYKVSFNGNIRKWEGKNIAILGELQGRGYNTNQNIVLDLDSHKIIITDKYIR